MDTVFTKIINGEIPSYKIAESENFLAFLDAMPLVEGHTLVIPKEPADKIYDMASEDYKELFGFAQNVAKMLEQSIECKRVGIAVVGLEVPHAHIHLIPLNKMDDMNFQNERLVFTDNEYKEIQNKIINL